VAGRAANRKRALHAASGDSAGLPIADAVERVEAGPVVRGHGRDNVLAALVVRDEKRRASFGACRGEGVAARLRAAVAGSTAAACTTASKHGLQAGGAAALDILQASGA
jgi:hypothetical protein